MGYPPNGGSNTTFLKLCPSFVGVCGGKCQEVQEQIGTECPGVHNVDGYCSEIVRNYGMVTLGSFQSGPTNESKM